MHLLGTLYQAEACAKLAVKRVAVITHHLEPAAFRRTFRAKRTDDDVATRSDAASDLPYVSSSLLWCSKKMEDGAIMPKVVCTRFQFDFRDISDQANAPARLPNPGGSW